MAYLEVKVMTFLILKHFRYLILHQPSVKGLSHTLCYARSLTLHDPQHQKVTYRPSLTFPILGGLRMLVSRRC